MAGIKQINTAPETFRFPKWRDDIFFAADSVVRYSAYMDPTDSDSDNLITKFYVAQSDVSPGTGNPTVAIGNWTPIISGTLDTVTILKKISDVDSDIRVIKHDLPAGDSDSATGGGSSSWDYGSF